MDCWKGYQLLVAAAHCFRGLNAFRGLLEELELVVLELL